MRRKRIVIFTLLILTALVGLYTTIELFGQRSMDRLYSPRKWINIEKGYKDGIQKRVIIPQSQGQKLRIAIVPIMSPEWSLSIYEELIRYVGKTLGMEPVILQRSSYSEIGDLLQYDNCEIGFTGSYPFVLGERDYGLKLLAVPRIKGKITYQSLIIVSAASEAQTLLDLKGKRFASCDILSLAGWVYPAVWLMQQGENPRKFFGEHIISRSNDRAVNAVVTGFADGAAVSNLVYERMIKNDPGLADKIRIIMKSPEFAAPPIVANPRLDPVVRERIQRCLFSMHELTEGRKILADLGIDRYEFPDSKLYDNVRTFASLWNPKP